MPPQLRDELRAAWSAHRLWFGIVIRARELCWRDYLSGETKVFMTVPRFEDESLALIKAVLDEMRALRRSSTTPVINRELPPRRIPPAAASMKRRRATA